MHQERLQNARDYFENIVAVAYHEFMQSEVTLHCVHAMAASLFHQAEWVFIHNRAQLQAKYGSQMRYGGELWDRVVARKIADADVIRDLTNTAKQVTLSFYAGKPRKGEPSGATHSAANTYISSVPFPAHAGSLGGSLAIELEKVDREFRSSRSRPPYSSFGAPSSTNSIPKPRRRPHRLRFAVVRGRSRRRCRLRCAFEPHPGCPRRSLSRDEDAGETSYRCGQSKTWAWTGWQGTFSKSPGSPPAQTRASRTS